MIRFFNLFEVKKMTNSSAKDINITINADKNNNEIDNNIDETYDEFKKYIIANNVILQKQRESDLIKIKNLEGELLQKENEEDKNDNRIRYFKGLLQNIYEINKIYVNLGKKYKNLSQLYQEIYKKSEIISYKYLLYSTLFIINISLLMCGPYLKWSYLYRILYYFTIISIIIYTLYKLISLYLSSLYLYQESSQILKIKIITSDISDKNTEIKKLEESSLALDNWICEI